MNALRPTTYAPLVLSLGLFACSDPVSSTEADAGGDLDTGSQDASSDASGPLEDSGVLQDAGSDDASTPDDTGADASSSDAAPADASNEDAARDSGVLDASTMDATVDAWPDAEQVDPRCMFLDLDVRYVRCDLGDYQLLRYFEDRNLGDAICPPYYVLRGSRYTSSEDALAAESCDGTCQYTPQNSFTVLRCGMRTGYELWTANECDDLYITPDGAYPSVEAWEMANPC